MGISCGTHGRRHGSKPTHRVSKHQSNERNRKPNAEGLVTAGSSASSPTHGTVAIRAHNEHTELWGMHKRTSASLSSRLAKDPTALERETSRQPPHDAQASLDKIRVPDDCSLPRHRRPQKYGYRNAVHQTLCFLGHDMLMRYQQR